MRIMHVLKHLNHSNGNVALAVDLAIAQAARGDDVSVGSASGTYLELLRAKSVEHRLTRDPKGIREAGLSAVDVVRHAVRFRPDVIHAHMMSASVMGYVASRVCGAALVTTVHNSFDRHSGFMKLGDAIVAVSDAERSLLLSRKYPSSRLRTVLNGVHGAPRRDEEPRDLRGLAAPCVATVCGLHPRKAVDDALRAFQQFHQTFPDWRFYIVGDGPDREKLEELAKSLGLAEAAIFLGPSRKPLDLLLQADIFVHSSVAEPFGLSIAEARLAGCAIVATDVGGVRQVLDNGRAGILVRPHDPAEMASKLSELASDKDCLRAQRAAALKGAESFDINGMAAEYADVYSSAIRRRRRWVSGFRGRH